MSHHLSPGEGTEGEVVISNMPLAIAFARRFYAPGRSMEFEDYLQEGAIALLHAVRNYKPRRGVKFSSYAGTCIWRRLQRVVSCHGMCGGGKGQRERAAAFASAVEIEEQSTVGLAFPPDLRATRGEIEASVDQILERLSDRERRALCLRYGIGDFDTLKELGDFLGVSRETVRQIQLVAMAKVGIEPQG